MNLNYTNQKKKSAVLHLGIASSRITNFPPFLTLQLYKGTAFDDGLCFKLKYPTQKLYRFFKFIYYFYKFVVFVFSPP